VPGANLRLAPAERIPFEEGSFDALMRDWGIAPA
jgi:hypothetical protein